jgi:multidrug efflux pump subunit AcrA (membrane-fusion protein)
MKAPGDGIVVYQQNYSLGSTNTREFQVGDQVWAGAALGEIPNLNTLEMEGKLDEIDRGIVEAGDEVRIRLDALPELTVRARLESISPLTQQSYEFPPTKSFRAYSPIEAPDPRLRPGMAATMEVIVEKIPDAVIVPAQAVFTKGGKPRVYVAEAEGFRALEIQVIARNPEEFAVEGLPEDAVIALVDAEDAR